MTATSDGGAGESTSAFQMCSGGESTTMGVKHWFMQRKLKKTLRKDLALNEQLNKEVQQDKEKAIGYITTVMSLYSITDDNGEELTPEKLQELDITTLAEYIVHCNEQLRKGL